MLIYTRFRSGFLAFIRFGRFNLIL
jgi:hypothetical protein